MLGTCEADSSPGEWLGREDILMGRASELEWALAREGAKESRAGNSVLGKGNSRYKGLGAKVSVGHEEAMEGPGWRAG